MKTIQINMRVLLFLAMVFTGFIAQAQDGKPTKEETIEYIESYFKAEFFTGGAFGEALETPGDIFIIRSIIIQSVAIEDCTLKFSYSISHQKSTPEGLYDPEITTYKNTINLGNVESISIKRERRDHYFYYLVFNEKNNSDNQEPSLPFALSYREESGFYDSQIYKAFQHLRKLCGAPEPLKFN